MEHFHVFVCECVCAYNTYTYNTNGRRSRANFIESGLRTKPLCLTFIYEIIRKKLDTLWAMKYSFEYDIMKLTITYFISQAINVVTIIYRMIDKLCIVEVYSCRCSGGYSK